MAGCGERGGGASGGALREEERPVRLPWRNAAGNWREEWPSREQLRHLVVVLVRKEEVHAITSRLFRLPRQAGHHSLQLFSPRSLYRIVTTSLSSSPSSFAVTLKCLLYQPLRGRHNPVLHSTCYFYLQDAPFSPASRVPPPN